MDTKYKAAVLLLGCLAALAIVHAGSVEEAAVRPTPAILFGGCGEASGNLAGVAYVVFPLGEMDNTACASTPGPPTHGVPMPSAGVLQNLRVTGGYLAGAGEGTIVTVYVNGASTTMTCTVDSTGKCADTTHKLKVNAGDEIAATYTVFVNPTSMTMALEKR